jgi:DNA-binding transcriptional regulator YiaG
MKKDWKIEQVDFQVEIPNDDGDAVEFVKTIKIPVKIDPKTGEQFFTKEAFDLIEQAQAKGMGIMSASEIKALRERFRLTQLQMSKLIRSGEKSYTRWESGRSRPSRLVNTLLCSIRDGFVPIHYLRRLYTDGNNWIEKLNDRPTESMPDGAEYRRICYVDFEKANEQQVRTSNAIAVAS